MCFHGCLFFPFVFACNYALEPHGTFSTCIFKSIITMLFLIWDRYGYCNSLVASRWKSPDELNWGFESSSVAVLNDCFQGNTQRIGNSITNRNFAKLILSDNLKHSNSDVRFDMACFCNLTVLFLNIWWVQKYKNTPEKCNRKDFSKLPVCFWSHILKKYWKILVFFSFVEVQW